jgi:hypothetical protein
MRKNTLQFSNSPTFLLLMGKTSCPQYCSCGYCSVDRRKIRLIGVSAKCRHLDKFTCKGTLQQVFIKVYKLEIYSQKWNCAASLFPKQNYNVLSPNFLIHVSVTDPGNIWLTYIESRNWEQGRAVLFLGIHKLDFRYSAVWYLILMRQF